MAMEIKAIPTLKGKEAEHFVKAADKAYKNQNKQDFSKHVLEAQQQHPRRTQLARIINALRKIDFIF